MRQRMEDGIKELCVEDFFEYYVGDYYGDTHFLKKVTLGAELALDVIERCDRHSINYATIFPDYTGVVKQLKLLEAINKRKTTPSITKTDE
jgi:hypothetical protein